MNIQEFNTSFAALINRAITDGCNLPSVINIVDQTKFELQLLQYNLRQQALAREAASKIIPITRGNGPA